MQISPKKAKAELCRRRLFDFVQEFWSEIIPEDPVWNWHIEYLCDEIQDEVLRICRLPERWEEFEGETYRAPAKPRQQKLNDVLVNIPPGTTKSTILSVMLPAWVWTRDPTIRIGSASYSGDLSMGLAMKSRDIIQSDRYKSYFPEVVIRDDSNNKQHYINTKGGERYSTSTGGTIVGIHFHLIIVDDPVNTKQINSDTQLDDACDFVNTTLHMRKVDKKVTLTIMVMQRLHDRDPSGSWLRMQKDGNLNIKHICLPAKVANNIQPPALIHRYKEGFLDPLRLGQEVLDDALVKLGSYSFAGQMGQNPAPEGGGIWEAWLIPVPDRDMPSPGAMSDYGTSWDTAYTSNVNNAASAYVTSGRIGNKMYIDGAGDYYKEFPELIHIIANLPEPHYIEEKASGKSIVDALVYAGIAAIGIKVEGDKIVRARTSTPKAEAGLIFCRASLLEYIYNDPDQGILKFPNAPKKDLADALSQEIMRHMGKAKRTVIIGWRKNRGK